MSMQKKFILYSALAWIIAPIVCAIILVGPSLIDKYINNYTPDGDFMFGLAIVLGFICIPLPALIICITSGILSVIKLNNLFLPVIINVLGMLLICRLIILILGHGSEYEYTIIMVSAAGGLTFISALITRGIQTLKKLVQNKGQVKADRGETSEA